MNIQIIRLRTIAVILVMGLVLNLLPMMDSGFFVSASGNNPRIYTSDADFDEGTMVNVNHDAPNNDQLQLDSEATPFNFIWVAASGRGTIVKIDTLTGEVLGEYWSAPEPDEFGKNPSRTTVDGNGNVWSGNRAEISCGGDDSAGSVVKIGLEENSQCVDHNSNGVIDTSRELGDIKDWPGPDVSNAEDECILLYVCVPKSPVVRHVSVDANNDVWVGGYPGYPTFFNKLDEDNGSILESFDASQILPPVGCGGYGGLIDPNGVLWSASPNKPYRLLRYDFKNPIPAEKGKCLSRRGWYRPYGLGVDTNGYIWNTTWLNGKIVKLDPVGVIQSGFPKGSLGSGKRGVVVTPSDNNVWTANSHSNSVTRHDNNGNYNYPKDYIPVGRHPTGVAVDAAGKVWVTNKDSHNVLRIDPASNSVDLTVSLGGGAFPYNYSDMTGSTLIAPPDTGTWTIVHDSSIHNAPWGKVTWNSSETGDSSISVTAASSADGITFGPVEDVTDGVDLTVGEGQYLKVSVTFNWATTDESPILYDLTILANQPTDCSEATPSQSVIWPPNHNFVTITVDGVTDPEGDPFTINIDSIFQDEPVDTNGDGSFTPDGMGIDTDTAEVRAERSGSKTVPGNGRVYHIDFTATDVHGESCSGELLVEVPHDKKDTAVDEGPLYDSTLVLP